MRHLHSYDNLFENCCRIHGKYFYVQCCIVLKISFPRHTCCHGSFQDTRVAMV